MVANIWMKVPSYRKHLDENINVDGSIHFSQVAWLHFRVQAAQSKEKK